MTNNNDSNNMRQSYTYSSNIYPIQKSYVNQQSIEKAQKYIKQTKDLLETNTKTDIHQVSPTHRTSYIHNNASPTFYDAIQPQQQQQQQQQQYIKGSSILTNYQKIQQQQQQSEFFLDQKKPQFKTTTATYSNRDQQQQQQYFNDNNNIQQQVRPQKLLQGPKRNLDISPPRFFEGITPEVGQGTTSNIISSSSNTYQRKHTPERLLQQSSSIIQSKASPRLLLLQPKTRKLYGSEVNIPEELLKKNEQNYNQSIVTLSKLEIKEKMGKWVENSQKWIWRNLLKLFVEALINNVKQLDDILPFFGKIYTENDYLNSIENEIKSGYYESPPELNYNNNINTNTSTYDYQGIIANDQVSADELLNYLNAYSSRNIQWNSITQTYTFEEFQKNHEKLIDLIEERKYWDKYLNIEGFKIYNVRYYVIKRLLVMQNDFKQLYYHEGIIQNKQYPTDTQIISNLTFNFIQDEINRKSNKFVKQIYFNLGSLGTSPLDYATLKKDEICFIQKNPPQYEPHFNLISGGEELYCMPNFFWALTLFSHCLSQTMTDSLGMSTYDKGLRDMINNIISLQLTTSSSPFMIKSLTRNK